LRTKLPDLGKPLPPRLRGQRTDLNEIDQFRENTRLAKTGTRLAKAKANTQG
jgi:hypothetical protein